MESSRLISVFAKFFSPGSKSASPGLPDFDVDSECLAQLTDSTWQASENGELSGEFSGLHFGCPLSNDRRELTRDTLLWCPHGWPAGKYVSPVSSRLGQRLYDDPVVADAIRTFFLHNPDDQVVVHGSGTTLDLVVQRASQLFGTSTLFLVPFPNKISQNWIAETLQPTRANERRVYFDAQTSTADELLFAVSDQVRVIHARRNGNIFRLVKRHDDLNCGPTIMALVDPRLDPAATNDVLREFGCVDWYIYGAAGETGSSQSGPLSLVDHTFLPDDLVSGDFLSHWTRSDRSPWPDQTNLSQLDKLFVYDEGERGALETLCRILVQQRLLASGRLIQKRQRVVCFTEVPLDEFPAKRVFRPQLSRWDFELFGISVRRSTIERLGGKPVKYVKKDWSFEREWRIEGDVNLRQVASDEAFVFVPDGASADIVRRYSRWPVVDIASAFPAGRNRSK